MKKIILSSTVLLPVLAFAQESGGIGGLFTKANTLISGAISVIFALAVLFFFWGLAQYILKAGEEKAAGLNMMIWGIIALFVMTSVYGLVALLSDSVLDDGAADTLTIPGLPQ